jgi:hypothetical protein
MSDGQTTTQAQPNLEQPPPTAGAEAALVPATAVGMPPTAQTFFAVVNADGSLARGFEAVSAQRLVDGQYEVIFSHDVTGSVYVASIGSSGSVGIEPTGEITVVGRFGTPNGVFITTTDSTGSFADRGFHLAVHS